MKAFVTGGTGFIGSHLVDYLIDSDRYGEIRCLIRNREKWLEDRPFTRISGDLQDLEALKRGIENVDVVFHLAGIVKAKSWHEFERGNVDATENVIRVARNQGVSNIIILSSLAAAGPSNGHPVTENDPMNPVSMYGKSKKQMEERVRNIVEEDISVTILRPAAVYGPRDEDIFTIFKLANHRICPIVGDGQYPKISLVYVKDVVQSIDLAAQRAKAGVETYNVADYDIYSWNRVREVLSEALDKKNLPIYIKPYWVKKLAGLVEKSASLFGSYPLFNRDKANEMVLEWTCSVEKAQKNLEFRPSVTLKEGFAHTVHWYKLHHWL